jgi:hypothetical protein
MRIGVDPIVRRSVEVQATLVDRRDEQAGSGSINVVRRSSSIRTTAALNAALGARCYPRSSIRKRRIAGVSHSSDFFFTARAQLQRTK